MKEKSFNGPRWAALTIIVMVFGGALFLALRPTVIAADFASVKRDAIVVTVIEEGETRVRDRFMVSAPVAGRVLRIEHESGDKVVGGETVMASFQPSSPILLDARSRAEAEARVGAADAGLGLARAERKRAAAELDFSVSEVERYRRLAAEQIVSRERLDSAELAMKTRHEALNASDFSVKSAAQELQAARAALLETDSQAGASGGAPIDLYAPVNGVVLRRLHESEAVVRAGEALIEIADPDQLEIVSDLLSTDAVKVSAGQRVLIEQWGGDHAIAGKVRRVEPYGFTKISALGVEEQRVNVVVDFEDPREAWNDLGDGYRVEVRIVIWEKDDVLQVPTGCLFRSGDDWAVFVVDDKEKARRTVIELGRRNALAAEVVSGLNENDRVILHPSVSIVDGVGVAERTL